MVMALAYVPIFASAPYPAIVASFFLTGFSISVNIALTNTFCASLTDSVAALGAISGAYGLGGTIGPLIATVLVAGTGLKWGTYYFIPLGMALLNCAFATWAFWQYEQQADTTSGPSPSPSTLRTQLRSILSSLRIRSVLFGALFIFAYQGAEVSIAGWIVSFLQESRGGSPDTLGYVSAGFWAGITIGRTMLFVLKSRISEKTFVYAAMVGAAAFEIMVWWLPSVIGPAISIAIVGLLLGPVYPCAVSVFTKDLPRSNIVSDMGAISAFGSSGGALAPFTTGLLAQARGPWVLHPVALGLFMVMGVCWRLGPSHVKNRHE